MTFRIPKRLALWLIPSLALAMLSASTLWLPYAAKHYAGFEVDAAFVLRAGLWIDVAWLIHLIAAFVVLRLRGLWLLFSVPFAYWSPAFFGVIFLMGRMAGK